MSGDQYSFQLINDAIRDAFPQLKSRMGEGTVGVDENQGKTLARLDVTPAEQVLGIEFQGWHKTVIADTMPALLSLEEQLSQR